MLTRASQLFVWNAVRGLALSEWIEATDDREEALDAADDAPKCNAGPGACCAARCADEELVQCAAMPWEVREEDVDIAQLLQCASECGDDPAGDVAAMPPAAAVRRLTELRLAHPLAAAGAGVLCFTAQVVALGCGVAAAAAASGPPVDLDDARARCARMCSLALSAVTVAVGAAVLHSELQACVQPPPLRPALLVSGVAGAGAIAYTLAFTAALPGWQSLEVAVSVLTAAASIMVRQLAAPTAHRMMRPSPIRAASRPAHLRACTVAAVLLESRAVQRAVRAVRRRRRRGGRGGGVFTLRRARRRRRRSQAGSQAGGCRVGRATL